MAHGRECKGIEMPRKHLANRSEAKEAVIGSGFGHAQVHSQQIHLSESQRKPPCSLRCRSSRSGISGAPKLALMLVVIIFLSRFTTSASAAVKETRRVLVFYEAGFSFPDIAIVDQEIRKALDTAPYK